MKKVLWFRRDLRVHDSMLLATEGEVLPIFIFDTNILNALEKNDKRVSFIFEQVLKLKDDLKAMGLDLALFYGTPLEVFTYLKTLGFSEVYASVDYDSYAKERDAKIAEHLNFHALNDCYLFEPNEVLKKDGTPYLVFHPLLPCLPSTLHTILRIRVQKSRTMPCKLRLQSTLVHSRWGQKTFTCKARKHGV